MKINLIGGKTKKSAVATRRERAKDLRKRGFSYPNIAYRMGISEAQVRNFVLGYYRGGGNKKDLATWAKYHQQYRAKNRKKILAYKKKYIQMWRRKFGMKKDNARKIVFKALRSGKLKSKPCICGNLKVEGHHDNYDKPLKVIWLCRKCHIQLHKMTV